VNEDDRCSRCGTLVTGPGTVDGVCSGCLLSLGLRGAGEDPGAAPASGSGPGSGVPRSEPRARPPRATLHAVGSGVAPATWAMPVELLRQASRRLALASFGIALASAASIMLTNLIEAVGWFEYQHLAIKNVVLAGLVAASAAMAWMARVGRLTPRNLLWVSLGYEVVVALAISLSDHLEPLRPDPPLATVSWVCVWIVSFPLVAPAPPRWAFLAGLASATTWPLAYYIGLGIGNPPAPAHVVATNVLEGYFAVALAMFTTIVMRRLQELGCYQLVEKLDRGGMGEIWRARHRMLARPVAIKLIRPELLGVRTPAEAAVLIARFKREAEATAGLHSPHTVALHDFGVTPDGVFYYVMEMLEGLDLETLVKRFGAVPPERAIHLLTQACESLADAHAAGLIHRDVKPSNILACHWGLKWDFVKVLDFGLVKARWNLGEDDQLTSEGIVAGTPAYMAPEAALGGRALDARVDLYGVGCVGYWLLTGERLFVGQTPMEMILHHVKTPPAPPSSRVSWPIPQALDELILSCLAKDPKDRPPSAEWLGDRLAECPTAQRWTDRRAREWWERYVPSDTSLRSPGPDDDTRTDHTPARPLASF
jgi:serine/threonine protein kinase